MNPHSPHIVLESLLTASTTQWNLEPTELGRHCLGFDGCRLASNGAVVAYSGKYSGRIPKDKFIVLDDETKDTVWWGGNSPMPSETFEALRAKAIIFLGSKKLYVVDALAGADPQYQIKVRFVLERPYHALFISQLLIKPTPEELASFEPDWVVMDAAKLILDPTVDGTRTEAAIVLNFSKRQVIIAGTEYAGEIKKSIFTVMNYLLPRQEVMSMHCSANLGKAGDSALFFGLSGTGKTSLSADPKRELIGDDEHGWSDAGVFNIEGGCYAKCINLTHRHEPEIWNAIRAGAVLENVVLDSKGVPDYFDATLTENTRAAYPLDFIPNARIPSVGGNPANIVFLTCDALGLLPPLSRLTPSQVISYFLNGYTAKVAGTESGVTEPTLTFSACFGQPFLPLNPLVYGKLLQQKIEKHSAKVWLLNTGWTEGAYGVGHRISIEHTRAMLDAVLGRELDEVPFKIHPIFELQSPISCPNVPTELLNPRDTWLDKELYDQKAKELQGLFEKNVAKFNFNRELSTFTEVGPSI